MSHKYSHIQYINDICPDNIPLLDEDFDLFSPEVIDFIILQRSEQEETPYMTSFNH
jgi:hypothetical protein